ncbi:hypothetical protein R1sor_009508 [Riccia sorocarpa]|uniref:Endonuclease/exonuclease/phosphatase domain-containing protein n=1 Tax=Riccia sorocarpa TaxID=122646 RepID=A0ABD3HVA0_9MARC
MSTDENDTLCSNVRTKQGPETNSEANGLFTFASERNVVKSNVGRIVLQDISNLCTTASLLVDKRLSRSPAAKRGRKMGTDLDVLAAQIAKNSEENRRLQQLLAEKTTMMQHAGMLPMLGAGQNSTSGGFKVLHAAHPLDKGKNVMASSLIPPQGKPPANSTSASKPLIAPLAPAVVGPSRGIHTGASASLRQGVRRNFNRVQGPDLKGINEGERSNKRKSFEPGENKPGSTRPARWSASLRTSNALTGRRLSRKSSRRPRQQTSTISPNQTGFGQAAVNPTTQPGQGTDKDGFSMAKGPRKKQVENQAGDNSNRFSSLAAMEEDNQEEDPTLATNPPSNPTNQDEQMTGTNTPPLISANRVTGQVQTAEELMEIIKEAKRKRELEEAVKSKDITKEIPKTTSNDQTQRCGGPSAQSRLHLTPSQGRKRLEKVKTWLRTHGKDVGVLCLQELRIKEELAIKRLTELAEGSTHIIDYTLEGKAGAVIVVLKQHWSIMEAGVKGDGSVAWTKINTEDGTIGVASVHGPRTRAERTNLWDWLKTKWEQSTWILGDDWNSVETPEDSIIDRLLRRDMGRE